MSPLELENFLHHEIPISKAFQVKVLKADQKQVELLCPLEPNHNHLGTAFGGSLAAVAILAGYTWIFQEMSRLGYQVHVLLKSSQADYSKPVQEDLHAICQAPQQKDFESFLKIFEKKGLARLHLTSEIQTSEGVACILKGEFVAQKVI